MGLQATLVLYAVIGLGVATAVFVRHTPSTVSPLIELVLAAMFWPLYVPMLISQSAEASPHVRVESTDFTTESEPDELTAAIVEAEAELDVAVASLDGWAEQTLASEADRFAELRHAWRVQAARIRELSQLLAQSTNDAAPDPLDTIARSDLEDRLSQSETARCENLRRLGDLRDKMQADLLETLARVRELVTMIHLARYTGAPASRAADLVTQIAAAVEGLSEVSDIQSDEMVAAGSVVS